MGSEFHSPSFLSSSGNPKAETGNEDIPYMYFPFRKGGYGGICSLILYIHGPSFHPKNLCSCLRAGNSSGFLFLSPRGRGMQGEGAFVIPAPEWESRKRIGGRVSLPYFPSRSLLDSCFSRNDGRKTRSFSKTQIFLFVHLPQDGLSKI